MGGVGRPVRGVGLPPLAVTLAGHFCGDQLLPACPPHLPRPRFGVGLEPA